MVLISVDQYLDRRFPFTFQTFTIVSVTIAISIRLWQEQALIPDEEEGHKVVYKPIIEFSAL